LGVRKDIDQAIFWLRKAADQDDAVSEIFLGEIYEDGDDVEVNEEAALCWYRKASQKDDPWKQWALKAAARWRSKSRSERVQATFSKACGSRTATRGPVERSTLRGGGLALIPNGPKHRTWNLVIANRWIPGLRQQSGHSRLG
jgi:hypothetical protein